MSDHAIEASIGRNGVVSIFCECGAKFELHLGLDWRHMDDVRAQEIAGIKSMTDKDIDKLAWELRRIRDAK